jgi:hypothetical protein
LIFESLEVDFSGVLGKVGADLCSLVLFWFQGSLFRRFWAMLRQVGAKMATKSGRMGGLVESWGPGGREKVQGRCNEVRSGASQSCWVPFS